MPYYELAFNIPIKTCFTYLSDEKNEAAFGKRVMAPLGKRDCLGFIVAERESPPPGLKESSLKAIRRVVDKEPVFDNDDLDLAKWVSGYYFCSLGEAISAMLPSGKKIRTNVFPGIDSQDSGIEGEEDYIRSSKLSLSYEQEAALKAIVDIENYDRGKFFYLFGITGSGKTEVFLRAAEAMLNKGLSVIYLVPEISLTHQTAEAITERFGKVAVTLHSGMTPAARFKEWVNIRRGEAKIVVGPRSAIFAPVKNLGLIIIDEEQDSSYKSGSTPRYHARQAAMKRASLNGAQLLMGSATPSIEAWKLMQEGLITRLDLKQRVSGGSIPEIIPVSLEKTEGCLSTELKNEIALTAAMKRQSILFLNRRGFAYYYHCRSCGYELKCKHCSVSLTWYKSRNRAICHYCGYSTTAPRSCPECSSLDAAFSGFGTEMVEEEVRRTFPDLKLIRIDADSTAKKNTLKKSLDAFRAGEADILLGTQMVAKGLNFPGVRLVGVVLADTALHLPDFRAAERTFSMLVQVAGRSGRYFPDGKVIIQTLRPNEPAIAKSCSLDLDAFYEHELEQREMLNFPPYCRIIRFTFRSALQNKVDEASHKFAAISRNILPAGTDILGPAECPLGIISGQHRRHILLRSKNMGALHNAAALILSRYEESKENRVYLEVDVDPVNLL